MLLLLLHYFFNRLKCCSSCGNCVVFEVIASILCSLGSVAR